MTLHPIEQWTIPTETALVARAAFTKGNVYMKMYEQLGQIYVDSDFQSLYPTRCGQLALSPGRLALITVMQFAEGLSDRQAADAVRSRIDWKYVLGLELTDSGFDHSVLKEFRERLIAGEKERQLLDKMLAQLKEQKLLKSRGRQRTDSTHVLAAIRQMNRLELAGETLRHALNELATVAPQWIKEQVSLDWFDRYGARFEQYRLPSEKAAKEQLALTIGADGHHILSVIYEGFVIDWDNQRVRCPIGQLSQAWRARSDDYGNSVIEVRFDRAQCATCEQRNLCTQAKKEPRLLKFRHREQHEALQAARLRQTTLSFKQDYAIRAGVEGTFSQGVRAFNLRRTRYVGLAKTHLQHIATAAAMNLSRLMAWWQQVPKAKTRISPFAALNSTA